MAFTQQMASSPDLSGGPPPDDALPGMQLGDYVVEKAVAWGGMGIVYRAMHPLIGRSVAVKVLRPHFASDPQQAARFLKEAQAISAIKHRGIIDVIGFGKLPDGRQYMVMEFLDGEPLDAMFAREGAMSAARVLVIADEILDALSAAHRVGVVHRDLKPSNVYIAQQTNGSRYVKLVDFGLARRAPLADLHLANGKASLMAGTPQYVSPEQVKELSATPRSDLYCLGIMLFELVTGRLPFTERHVIELLKAHLHTPPPRASTLVPSIPPALDDIIYRMMAKKEEDRPASAEVARQEIQRVMRELKIEPSLQPRDAPTSPSLPRIKSVPRPYARSVALAIFVGAVLTSGVLLRNRARAKAAIAEAAAAQVQAQVAPVAAEAVAPARPSDLRVVAAPIPAPNVAVADPKEAAEAADPADEPGRKRGKGSLPKKRAFAEWDNLTDPEWRSRMLRRLDGNEARLRSVTKPGEEVPPTAVNLIGAARSRVKDASGKRDRLSVNAFVASWEKTFLK